MSCMNYADIESLIRKIDGCANNPEIFSATKVGEHILCGYSVLTIWTFDHIENQNILYRWEHTKNIIDLEKQKMLPLTKEELKLHEDEKYVTFVEKES